MKTLQRTLTIVKPDAVNKNAVGDIIEQFEKNHFHILAMKMLEISKHQAQQFYAVHASRPFYNSLTDFMSSGPIVVLALEVFLAWSYRTVFRSVLHARSEDESAPAVRATVESSRYEAEVASRANSTT